MTDSESISPKRLEPAQDDDAEWISGALAGDPAAFEQLVRRHQDRLYVAMIQITGSCHDAEEVTQEAFIKAFVKLNTFQHNSQFFTWLYRVAFNIALSRKRRRQVRISLDQQREDAGDEVIDSADGVDAGLIREDHVSLVRTALATLSDQHQAILVLREMNEASYEEIAQVLELSIGTVRSRLNRARTQLRLAIEKLQVPSED
ncbi:MAG: sigma-70 family RNA polymerase sigma factor [Planctomycetota bacterium]